MNLSYFTALALAFGLSALGTSALGSDHADPQSVLNPFKPLNEPPANITDLHSFLADKDGRPILEDITIQDDKARQADAEARISQAQQLIISLCVRRRLLPGQIADLQSKEKLSDYAFRVHLDLNPDLRHFDPTATDAAIAALDAEISKQSARRDRARAESPPIGGIASKEESDEQGRLNALLAQRGQIYAQRQQDALMERLYGGIIDRPESIAEEAILDFHLELKPDGANSETVVVMPSVDGIPSALNLVTDKRLKIEGGKVLIEQQVFKPGAINVQSGIFDDPFIFPRFFRGNVIGIVVSIPLDSLRQPGGAPVRHHPILLWATTHQPDGSISDHVGRSLRTQLPRFGYLNPLHPSRHAAEILRVHAAPTLLTATMTRPPMSWSLILRVQPSSRMDAGLLMTCQKRWQRQAKPFFTNSLALKAVKRHERPPTTNLFTPPFLTLLHAGQALR